MKDEIINKVNITCLQPCQAGAALPVVRGVRIHQVSLVSHRECSCSAPYKWFPSRWETMCSQPGVREWGGSWLYLPWFSYQDTWSTCILGSRALTRRWDQKFMEYFTLFTFIQGVTITIWYLSFLVQTIYISLHYKLFNTLNIHVETLNC